MDIGIDAILFLVAVAFTAGAIDAIAGGGGLLTIPALLSVGLPPVTAIATNKLQSSFSVASAVAAFAWRGHIDFRRFLVPALGALAGSALGAFALTQVDSHFLSGLIPFLLIAMAAYFTFAPRMTEEDRAASRSVRAIRRSGGLRSRSSPSKDDGPRDGGPEGRGFQAFVAIRSRWAWAWSSCWPVASAP